MKIFRRSLVTGAVAIAAIASASAPASAPASAAVMESFVSLDMNTGPGGYQVLSTCKPVLVASTDARFLTFVLEASADASGPSVALSTTVTCTMHDTTTNQPVGGASGGLVGPHAEAVGTAVLPLGHLYKLCVSGGASYLSGYSIGARPC